MAEINIVSNPQVNNVQHVHKVDSCKNRIIFIITSVILTSIAAVAAYFCLLQGLTMLDTASTSLLKFSTGFLIYSGATFSVVAVANALYLGGKLLCHDETKPFIYSPNEIKYQIVLSVFSPIAAIPCIIVLGLNMALRR